ncbi:MAG TPA: SigE family RNA polymerase sigma factor [Phytomonospora sp.]
METDLPAAQFEEFVRTRTPALMRTAFLLTGDQHLAEDLVQSALARAHRAWSRIREEQNAEAYTRKIMYHLQVSWWRRKRLKEQHADVLPEPPVTGDSAEDSVRRIAVWEALARLTPRQRAVLVLRFYEDRSVVETAELLSCSEGAVKSQTSKALNLLRTKVPELRELRFFTEGSVA